MSTPKAKRYVLTLAIAREIVDDGFTCCEVCRCEYPWDSRDAWRLFNGQQVCVPCAKLLEKMEGSTNDE